VLVCWEGCVVVYCGWWFVFCGGWWLDLVDFWWLYDFGYVFECVEVVVGWCDSWFVYGIDDECCGFVE